MLQEQYIWQMAEAALNGTLTPAQKQELDARLVGDEAFAQAYHESLNLLQSLEANGRQRRFKASLKEIHEQVTAPATKTRTFRFNPSYIRTTAMAAGIALATSLTTMWMMKGDHHASDSHVQDLRREVDVVKRSQMMQQQQINNIKDNQQTPGTAAAEVTPSNYTGTGFALSNDGFVVTNYHVTEGADSIYVLTRDGAYHRASVIGFEPKTDVAILKINDKKFRFSKTDVPYMFATSKAPLGAHIYTLGFPQDEIVYNEGYISSRNGYEGDSIQYRLEVVAAPGQSGAPVLDHTGNVVGIIKSKENSTNSTTYAISSKALLRLVHDIDVNNGIRLPKTNRLTAYTREQQVDKLQDFTCMIQVYKRN